MKFLLPQDRLFIQVLHLLFAGLFTAQGSLFVFRPDGFSMREGHDEPRIESLGNNSRNQGEQHE